MLQNQRIIFSDNGVESDLSLNLNNFRTGNVILPYVVNQDYLYIGTDLPFNHKYIDILTVNDVAATVNIEIWYSNAWIAAVDIIDETSVSGKALAQSGIIQWKTNRLKGWSKEQDSEDVGDIATVGIYNMYWIRMKWNASLKATTTLKYIGYKFSNDSALYGYYPDLNNDQIKASFATGKTDWNEQHFIAAEQIIRDLKTRNLIISSHQILDYEHFLEPAIHKVAEMIYCGLGKAYEENRKLAKTYYDNALKLNFFNVDRNADANLSESERSVSTSWLSR